MANIEKRGDNSYRFTVYLPKDSNGKYPKERKTITIDEKMTPKQLKEYLDHEYLKFKNEVLSGNYVKVENMTFKQFAEEWKQKHASKLSKTTYGNHVIRVDKHLTPVLGHMEMNKITTMTLLNLMQNLTRKDDKDGELSDRSKRDIYQTLSSIFTHAQKWKVIINNPMDGVAAPKFKKKKLEVYEEYEIKQILSLVQSESMHWRIMITLALTSGLRRGELLGLEWKHIDFKNNQIEIIQTIALSKDGPVIKDTKTDSSERIVSLPESMAKELKEYRKQWVKDKLKNGERWTENGHEWLFCNEHGEHLYPSSPSNWWNKFLKKHKFRHIRFHDLRHTSASLLIAQGVHAKIISERLGHSRIGITMDTYGHVMRSADRTAADKLESLFKVNDNIK